MSNEKTKETGLSRRAMLMRLGLVAGVAYSAPILLQLGEAQAGSFSKSRPGRSFSGRGRRPQPRPTRSFSGPGRRLRRSFS